MVGQSNAMLRCVEPLIPASLRSAVKAGPLDEGIWCLLITGNAAAAKVRQLKPLIEVRLSDEGWKVTSIRLKVVNFR
jgi:hypothetical protein